MRHVRLLVVVVVSVASLSSAARAERPALTATPNAAGEVLVTWTLPSGHTSTNLHWSADPSTVATPESDPSEGEQMKCFASGPSDGVHNCTGGRDLGETQTSYTIKGLAPGTYYAQVMTYGLKKWLDKTYNVWLDVHYYGYSPVVEFKVSAPSSGGSGSQGSGGTGGSGGSTGGTTTAKAVKVEISKPVTIAGEDGRRSVVDQPTEIKPFNSVLGLKTPVRIGLNSGALVVDRNSALQYVPKTGGNYPAWRLTRGQVYVSGFALVALGDTSLQSGGGGEFTVAKTGAGGVVQALSRTVTIASPTKLLAKLQAGQQARIDKSGKLTITKAAPPKNRFWTR